MKVFGILRNYTASCGNYLPTFRDNVSVPSSRVKIPRGKKTLKAKVIRYSNIKVREQIVKIRILKFTRVISISFPFFFCFLPIYETFKDVASVSQSLIGR
jgi:hypothetical protein